MKIEIVTGHIESIAADVIAIATFKPNETGQKKPSIQLLASDGGIAIDKSLDGAITRELARSEFKGDRISGLSLFTAGRIPAKHIHIIGLGPRKGFSKELLREAGANIARAAIALKAESIALVIENGSTPAGTVPERAKGLIEGIRLGGYRFNRYKTKDGGNCAIKRLVLIYRGNKQALEAACERALTSANAQNWARDMTNTPGCDLTPALLAERAQEMAAKSGLAISVWDEKRIAKEKMGGILAVSRGSSEPPRFIEISYLPKKAHHSIALIGKGITFDAGGISLKQPKGMEAMKGDMAGAATVLAAMKSIAALKPATKVTAYIPAAENLPDGKAFKPGDVIEIRNGTTVEIISTDSEGRLLLADALSYASTKGHDLMIDLATLTGGAPYCCGELYSLAMGNDQRWIDRLIKTSLETGEPIWQLPLVDAYRKGYTSGIADLNTSGKSKAQTILGGIFLREFVEKTPWIHIDIAASAYSDDETTTGPRGGTGVLVRTLTEFTLTLK